MGVAPLGEGGSDGSGEARPWQLENRSHDAGRGSIDTDIRVEGLGMSEGDEANPPGDERVPKYSPGPARRSEKAAGSGAWIAPRSWIPTLLTHLKLVSTLELLGGLLETSAKGGMSFRDFLDRVIREEVQSKDQGLARMRIQIARFPLDHRLEGYDFRLQPSLGRRLTTGLETSTPCQCHQRSMLGLPLLSSAPDTPKAPQTFVEAISG